MSAGFLRYELQSEVICLGERLKAGWFRPCTDTIPYSQISGALRWAFGETDLHAAGHLCCYEVDHLVQGPRDRVREISRIPLRVQVLRQALGSVYVLANEASRVLPEEFEVQMGALRSKGLGQCYLRRRGEVPADVSGVLGTLNTRIPLGRQEMFGLREVQMPVHGYLFEPTSLYTGNYVLSLFEGTRVVAPPFLLREFCHEDKRRDLRVDEIQMVLQRIEECDRVWQAREYTSNFLENVGTVLADHGFGVAGTFLATREERRERDQAAGLKEVLRLLEACPRVHQNRGIGRQIITSLETLRPEKYKKAGDQKRRAR